MPRSHLKLMQGIPRLRQWAGAVLRDLPSYRKVLNAGDRSYLSLCNRHESLEAANSGEGFRCTWRWTSDLEAPKQLPWLGRQILVKALADHPIVREHAPEPTSGLPPEVSFVIGHRGSARLPHLLATLESIAGQTGARVECVVVEQDTMSTLAPHLPPWVRHIHTPPPDTGMAYCRSWAFNVGVRHARSGTLVLHDNDMLVPRDYAAALLSHFRAGFEVVNLKRFVFYLTEAHSDGVFSKRLGLADLPPLAVMQNAQGGGSAAITREGYERIGGMDESFVGWGGEDNEWWERAQTLRVWPYAYLPLVHLWHAAQPGKQEADHPTQLHYQNLSAIAPAERVARLRLIPSGNMTGPQGWSARGPGRCAP